MIRRLVVVALVVTACTSVPPTPTDERASIRRAAVTFVEAGGSDIVDEMRCCPTGIRARAGRVRVSAKDPTWATASVPWTDDDGERLEPWLVVLHHDRRGWVPKAFPGPEPGCGLPEQVRRELALKAGPTCDRVTSGPSPGPDAEAEVDEQDGVRATITYDAFDPAYGEAVVELRIERHGKVLFESQVAPVDMDQRGTNPTVTHGSKAIDVVDLDDDGEPEVLLDLYWGGAHCCTWSEVYRWDGAADRYQRGRYLWGDNDYDVRDLDGDGRPELVTLDDRFAYAFTSFAGSAFPVQVLQYERGRMIDVTRRYPDLVATDAAEQRRGYEEVTGTENEDRGALGAWAADECLLDRCDPALAEVHRRAPTSTSTTTDFPPESYAAFERHLRTKLTRLGYRRLS